MGLTWKPCTNCGKSIAFARHDTTGKHAPLERDPNGRWTVVHETYFQAAPTVAAEHRYTSHFATCPGAAGFRRG